MLCRMAWVIRVASAESGRRWHTLGTGVCGRRTRADCLHFHHCCTNMAGGVACRGGKPSFKHVPTPAWPPWCTRMATPHAPLPCPQSHADACMHQCPCGKAVLACKLACMCVRSSAGMMVCVKGSVPYFLWGAPRRCLAHRQPTAHLLASLLSHFTGGAIAGGRGRSSTDGVKGCQGCRSCGLMGEPPGEASVWPASLR